MTNREPKYHTDFFIYRKKYHWFLIPAIIVFYNKEEFCETGVSSPAFGISLRWLTFFMGIQIQKNIYYKNGK
jgi:hypothetical protein